MIRSLFWNARRVGNKPTIARLRKLCRLYSLSLVTLCEPLLGLPQLDSVRVTLNFPHGLANTESCILVFFDHSWLAVVVAQSAQFLALRMSNPLLSR